MITFNLQNQHLAHISELHDWLSCNSKAEDLQCYNFWQQENLYQFTEKSGVYSPKYPNGPLSLNLDSTLIYIFLSEG